MGAPTQVTVTARCVCCGHTREIKAGEIAKGDHPMCPKCYSPMVAERAIARGD